MRRPKAIAASPWGIEARAYATFGAKPDSSDRMVEPLPLACGPAMKNRFMLAPLTNRQSHADGMPSDVLPCVGRVGANKKTPQRSGAFPFSCYD